MRKTKAVGGANLDQLIRHLEDLKRLAILQLLISGVQGIYIAKALGVHSSAISRMLPARQLKKHSARA
jgi:IS30 family transposase